MLASPRSAPERLVSPRLAPAMLAKESLAPPRRACVLREEVQSAAETARARHCGSGPMRDVGGRVSCRGWAYAVDGDGAHGVRAVSPGLV